MTETTAVSTVTESLIPANIKKFITPVMNNALDLNPSFNEKMLLSFAAHLELAFSQNPKLSQCTGESMFKAVTTCVQLGLMPTLHAHIIPFVGKETVATLLPEAKGLMMVLRRHPAISDIQTSVVYQRDEFDEGKMFGIPTHKPSRDPNPGPVIGAYAAVKFSKGGISCEFLTKTDIDNRRKMSRSADGPAWKNSYNEMARAKAVQAWCARYGHGYLAPSLMEPLEEAEVITVDAEPEEVNMMISNLHGDAEIAGYVHDRSPETILADARALVRINELIEENKFSEARVEEFCQKAYGVDSPIELSYDQKIVMIRKMAELGAQNADELETV